MTAGKSTRVLLVRPRPPADSIGLHHFMICDPIELTQVAAALPAQFDVRIFDGILEGGDRPLRRAMADFQPDVVAATCYINGVDEVGKIFAAARTVVPRALRVVGGVHATLNSEDFVKVGPDVLVAGEGTFTFRDLCVAFREGGRSGLAGVPGTALFTGAGFDFAAPRPWPCPDDLPIARRELVRRHWPEYYYIYHRPCFMLKTAFGCPYTCGFCYCWKVTGGAYQYASPERVVDELAGMWARDAYIVDDDFLLHPERLERFCELMEKRRVKKGFFCYGRADFISNYPDLIKRLSRVGLKAVVVGVESFSRRELTYYHKQSHEEHNARCFDTLRRANVDVYASFILSPDWGLEDFREMQQYIYKHRLYYVILQPLMPLPGTDIWEEWKDQVIIDRDHHSLWDISHLCLPSRLPMEVYYREMIKLYIKSTLDLRRLPGLKLRTLPPLWSPQIPRNVWGAAKILWQLAHAHERYRPGEVARYQAGMSRPIFESGGPSGRPSGAPSDAPRTPAAALGTALRAAAPRQGGAVLRVVEYPDARRLDPAWERARPAGQNVAMPGFLRAYETAAIEGVTLRYLGVYDGARFLGGAAFSQVGFRLDLMAPKPVQEQAARVRRLWPGFAQLRAMTCGVWAGQGGNEAVVADGANGDAVINRLAERAEALARSAGSNVVVFKEFRTEETTVWDRLLRHGYVRLHSLPFAAMEIRWRSFGEYLQALRAGYRRQARANLAHRDLPGVTLDLAERIEDHAEEFHPLYMQVMDHTDFHIETLTPAFFRNLGRELGPAIRLVTMRRDGGLLGGALMAFDRDHATFLYAGFDYARLREHDTYFNLLYAMVEAAIAAGCKQLLFGQLSSDAKTRMGARMSEVFAYAKGRGFPLAPVVTYLGNQLYPPHPMPVRHVFK